MSPFGGCTSEKGIKETTPDGLERKLDAGGRSKSSNLFAG
jgi:hypothetical protein